MEVSTVNQTVNKPEVNQSKTNERPDQVPTKKPQETPEPKEQGGASPSVTVSISQQGVERAREAAASEDSNSSTDHSDENINNETVKASSDDKNTTKAPTEDSEAVLNKLE